MRVQELSQLANRDDLGQRILQSLRYHFITQQLLETLHASGRWQHTNCPTQVTITLDCKPLPQKASGTRKQGRIPTQINSFTGS